MPSTISYSLLVFHFCWSLLRNFCCRLFSPQSSHFPSWQHHPSSCSVPKPCNHSWLFSFTTTLHQNSSENIVALPSKDIQKPNTSHSLTATTVVWATIISHIDYYNSLLPVSLFPPFCPSLLLIQQSEWSFKNTNHGASLVAQWLRICITREVLKPFLITGCCWVFFPKMLILCNFI